jgi:2-desacetyl-2-hydroxyethyl bacteriochlorophyllide A dehydrogenase
LKVAVYEGVKSIKFEERPIPKAGPGEAVIKIKYCGICGTDMHIYFEGILPPGIVIGHENVGTVAEIGPGVSEFKVGDRVVAGPPGPCGKCYYCLHGKPSICVDGFENTNGLRRDGGMAEYMLVKDARQMLFKIPDNVSFEDAVLIDTIATAYRGIIQSVFKLGDNVVLAGAGPIGLSVIQFLKLGGARHITVLEIVEERRKLAGQCGADIVLDPVKEGGKLTDKILALYDGIGADIVFECAGVPQSFELCLTLARASGQVLNLGVTETPASIAQGFIVRRELDIKSSLAYGGEEVHKCLYYLSSGRFSTKGLLSDVIPLSDLVEKGFNRLAVDKSLIKVAVAP